MSKLGAITPKIQEGIMERYEKDPLNKVVRHALSRHSLSNVIYEPASVTEVAPTFSIDLKTMGACNQKVSGRCWIFAALNLLREKAAKKLGLKKFELSQNYISLFDKIEKSNYALETILEIGDWEPTDRLFQFVLEAPVNDGGQWDMFVSLVKKYGLMPQEAFPETYQSNNTRETDQVVNAHIRHFASLAHPLLKNGQKDEARALKEKFLEDIYTMFLNAFGVPSASFDYEWENNDGYHLEKGLTPHSFFEKFVGDDIDSYISLINSPTADKPYMRNYTVDHLGSVYEGKPINHLNLEMERVKELIIKQLEEGEPVWFGSDVSFYRDRNSYAWSTNSLDYRSMFGFDIRFEKGAMLDFRNSAMGHAMLITGVDIKDGKAVKWKIENSWGTDNGLQGYYVMNDEWFDIFVYQAVVREKYLSDEEKKAAKGTPIHLDPWDPMGTLAA